MNLFFAHTIPSASRPGSPAVFFCDNGDWDIAFVGDLPYIEDYTSAYVGSFPVMDLFQELAAHYEQDDIDDDGEVAHLVASMDWDDPLEEPVVMISLDGEFIVCERIYAEKHIKKDSIDFNFIPISDLFEDLARFIANNKRDMFDDREMDPPYQIEDED